MARPAHKAAHRSIHVRQAAVASRTAGASGSDRDDRYPAPAGARRSRPSRPPAKPPAVAVGAPPSRTPIRPLAASPRTRWFRKRANISAPTRPGAAACGAAPSWTWCSSAPAIPAAATSPAAYARYGTRVSGPQVGAIAVMGHRRRRRRGHRRRSERQSDHRVRQPQSHGRRIGLSARTDLGLCDAGRLIVTTCRTKTRLARKAGRVCRLPRGLTIKVTRRALARALFMIERFYARACARKPLHR